MHVGEVEVGFGGFKVIGVEVGYRARQGLEFWVFKGRGRSGVRG